MRTLHCIAGAVALVLTAQPARAAAAFECLIEPWQVVDVRAAVEGMIAQVHVQRGDSVRRGQVLVELQSGPERAAVESARFRSQMEGQLAVARSRLDYAERKLTRSAELQRQSYVSAQARDEAEAERRLAEAELRAATENRELARLELRRATEQLALRTMASPFDGVVLDRLLNPGDLAEYGSGRKPVLRIAQIDPLRVDVVLPAALYGQIAPGRRATVVPHGLGGRHEAVVKLVDKVVDAASGTFVARLELPNPKRALPGGVRCLADVGLVAPVPAALPPRPQP